MASLSQKSIQKVCPGRLFALFLTCILISLSACSPVQRPEDNHGFEVEGFNKNILDDSPVQVALVVMVDEGEYEAEGSLDPLKFGCGDSIQTVEKKVSRPLTEPQRIETALNELFAIEDRDYGESGLYNALYQSKLQVEKVELGNRTVRVELSGSVVSGGTCDDPRIVEQITKTIKLNGPENLDEITVILNGEALDDYFDRSGQ